MRRREFLTRAAALGAAAGAAELVPAITAENTQKPSSDSARSSIRRLIPPAKGSINVAFVLTEGATVLDFAGPWEVFQDVHVEGRGESMDEMMPFRLYTVSDKNELIEATGGLKIMPDFTFGNAPPPRIIVIPAQGGRSKAMMDWLRKNSQTSDVTMSVCTGAFVLGTAGLLDGMKATTHHHYQDDFAKKFPKVSLQRGVRFVENDRISTAGGLSSGMDLALHVVQRYFGRQVAQQTADYMEYQGKGWMV